MTFWSQMGFQDIGNSLMLSIKIFHEDIMLLLLFLAVFTLYYFIKLWVTSVVFRSFNHHESLEILYTLFPFLCLMVLGVLSMKVLFSVDDNEMGHDLSIKVVGHQWYWSYAYSNNEDLSFDSYMMNVNKLGNSNFHYLDTDHHVVVSNESVNRMVTTSEDVLHSWAVPSLGIKMDVIPGRLNTINMVNKMAGLFFGQCSEICGVNHAFMPICVEVVPVDFFKKWVMSF